MASRNTPTCVGKTERHTRIRSTAGKHPHVRGEDGLAGLCFLSAAETPPRAWGRRHLTAWVAWCSRNTPTCVGKTLQTNINQLFQRKHPHVRGEDSRSLAQSQWISETPPRAWGRPLSGLCLMRCHGNTPTCVGKTARQSSSSRWGGKHPHVRGEDKALPQASSARLETPPRAWGRRSSTGTQASASRNTPTCVGKTHQTSPGISFR